MPRVADMIVLFTDFGFEGPYLGQVKAVLAREAPGVPVIDLFADAPAHEPRLAAYLLAAYVGEFPPPSVFLCVVDPGVGDPARRAVVLDADGRWFVGPDNGLFNVVGRRARSLSWWDLTWRPERLSASFHGRDLFAPVAARLARGEAPSGQPRDPSTGLDQAWPDELWQIVYVDRFGNAMTGVRAATIQQGAVLEAGGRTLSRARTFSEVGVGEAFWYENANGLAEIAVNRGRASEVLGLAPGAEVAIRGA